MQSCATILAKTSYGKNFQHNDTGPFESLIQFLMKEKAKKVYPHKQQLIEFQINLLEASMLLRKHNGNIEQSKKFLEQIQQLQNEAKFAIEKINHLDTEFKKYSNELIAQAKIDMPKALDTLIESIEKSLDYKITDDIKLLFYTQNNMPLSNKQLINLKKERGI